MRWCVDLTDKKGQGLQKPVPGAAAQAVNIAQRRRTRLGKKLEKQFEQGRNGSNIDRMWRGLAQSVA